MFLSHPCHEGSTAVQAAFIMKNNVKTSDINTVMLRTYIQANVTDDQGEYNQEYNTKPRCMCLCDTQYYNGQNTNINICCIQQSAHNCQVSNSSLDIQRSVHSLSGSFLRSANLGKSDVLCTEGCIDYTLGNLGWDSQKVLSLGNFFA